LFPKTPRTYRIIINMLKIMNQRIGSCPRFLQTVPPRPYKKNGNVKKSAKS